MSWGEQLINLVNFLGGTVILISIICSVIFFREKKNVAFIVSYLMASFMSVALIIFNIID